MTKRDPRLARAGVSGFNKAKRKTRTSYKIAHCGG